MQPQALTLFAQLNSRPNVLAGLSLRPLKVYAVKVYCVPAVFSCGNESTCGQRIL